MQVELKVPVLPESVTEGTLGEWYKKIGDTIAVDENVVDLETDKVVLEIVATTAGVLESISFQTGDTVKDGQVLGVINSEVKAVASPVVKETPEETPEEADISNNSSANKASPSVRKFIAENNLTVDEIAASGKKGTVSKEDVQRFWTLKKNRLSLKAHHKLARPALLLRL